MTHSTRPAARQKPKKPWPDFPLFPHSNGQWCKTIRGKKHYFGTWADPSGALDRYKADSDDLFAGRTPRSKRDGLTVIDLCNHYIAHQSAERDAGKITQRTWNDCEQTCERVLQRFDRSDLVVDITPQQFGEYYRSLTQPGDSGRRLGLTTISNVVRRVRAVFNFAFKHGLIDNPIRFGSFRCPSKTDLRIARQRSGQSHGARDFSAEEIRAILAEANTQIRAMTLLGINAGLGNEDCASLPLSALDLDRGWLDFPRPKTGIERRCPLWPETIEALRDWLKVRPKPFDRQHDHLVFITRWGGSWSKDTPDNPVTKEYRKLLRKAGIQRRGLGFYGLRRSFETASGGALDQVATNYVMGHVGSSMAGIYRQRIADDRLRAVTNFVRDWLFADDS